MTVFWNLNESTGQRAESIQPENHEDHIVGKGIYFCDTLEFGAQVYSDAPSDENSGCESSSG